MTRPLLATKLAPPRPRPNAVPRPHLVRQLNAGMRPDCKLTLISAPAGFGKTTLLSEWIASAPPLAYVAWLSLDEADNDSARFLAYLRAALQAVCPAVGEAAWAGPPSASASLDDATLAPLVNALAQVESSFALILDDYHVIQEPGLHAAVNFLLEHQPPAMRLVIATRSDPPLGLARLRARGQLTELRQADLRFTSPEVASFLAKTMGLQMPAEAIAGLANRTEGWIAGLQMAALSLQGGEEPGRFVSRLTGNNRYIFDYLLEEVLARQPPEVREFLLKTSVLGQMTAPLCEALTGNANSQSLLKQLEQANLFIVPLDDERRWYRYHHLFAELLRSTLQQTHADQIPPLHVRASVWFEAQGLIANAIHHALAAGEGERATRLVEGNVFALLEQSELNAVARQLDQLAAEKDRPWLWLARAWLAAYTGQLGSIEPLLAEAEAGLSACETPTDQQTLRGHLAAIRAYMGFLRGEEDIAVQAAEAALEYLPPDDRLMRCQVATTLGLALQDAGQAAQAFEQAIAYAQGLSISHVTISAYGCQAYLFATRDRLREAYAVCQTALQLARTANARPLPTLSFVYVALSVVLLEWNDLENADRYAREAVVLARQWEQADALHHACTQLTNVRLALGDYAGAFDSLRLARQLARRTSSWFESISIEQEIELHLAQGNPAAAIQCLRAAPAEFEGSPRHAFASVHILIAQKQFAKAAPRLADVVEFAGAIGATGRLLRALTWQALVFHELGQEAQALAALTRALTLAAPEGYVHVFTREGAPMAAFLRQVRAAEVAPGYVEKLLAAFGQTAEVPAVAAEAASPMVEPLSEREMGVLKLLAQGCTDKQMAAALVIGRETVHQHLKNIYGKLGVHRRLEAVAAARKLGLL
jgi:LuxR family maltose regulon positive regulatory protein